MKVLSLANALFESALLVTARGASGSTTQIPSHANIEVKVDPSGEQWPYRVFKSSPYTPPNLTITGNGGELAPGYVFLTPDSANLPTKKVNEDGGIIVTTDNELVYWLAEPGITDLRVEVYKGKPYVVYWSGYNTNGANIGHGYGQVNFVDATYKNFTVDPDLGLTKLLKTTNPKWSIDIHEHQLTSRNTLLVSAYNNTPYDLTAYGGPGHGWIADSMFFELDIATSQVLFSWTASDHVPLNSSHQPIITPVSNATESAPWDWFHINSVDTVGSDYLVNGRHVWSTYAVSRKDGSVIWSIEGENGGSFGEMPADGAFSWQHYVRAHNVTPTSLDLSMFDNHNSNVSNGTGPSNGLVFHLELPASKSYTPQLLRKIETPSDEIYAESQGIYTPDLPNGNQFLGYGSIAVAREYGPATDGSDLRWQATFGDPTIVQSYRAFKYEWTATPAAWDPSLAVVDGKAYVSWNGDTQTTEWNVYSSLSSGTVTKGVAAKKGFETVFEVPSGAKTVHVGAVQHGTEVRQSNTVKIS